MIIRGGENIYPREIESHIATHPAVLESAVVGAAHPTLGEVPVAYVVAHPGDSPTVEEMLALLGWADEGESTRPPYCRRVFAENPIGKIDKPELRRRTAPF